MNSVADVVYVDVNEKYFKRYRESFDFTNHPREALAEYINMNSVEREKWFLERFKCLRNSLYLASYARVENG
jgi:hypothetical protein